ncbi:MAG: hypothetical protein FIA99_11545 [Ruminiclostridium sp.]|nr:hypothetical protein [Ruminiclostridium sp.]
MENNLSTSSFKPETRENTVIFNVIKLTALLGLALALLLFFEGVLQNNDSVTERKRKIMNLGRNEVDIMFIGNSHAYCSFNPVIVEEKVDARVFNAGIPDQKIDMTYYYLLDLLKRQSPSVVIMEAFVFGRSESDYQGYVANVDSMDFSLEKIKACLDIFPDPLEAAHMSLRLFRSHNNWKKPSIIKNNLKYYLGMQREGFVNKGFYTIESGMSEKTIKKYKDSTDSKFTPVIDEYSTKYFDKIVDLCKERSIRLIVTMAPFNSIYLKKVSYGKIYEKIQAICDAAGVEYIDFNMLYDELGLTFDDFEDAFHNAQHTNVRGAEKISRYMGEYLSKAR